MKKKIPMILACSLLLALAGCSAGGADSRAEAENAGEESAAAQASENGAGADGGADSDGGASADSAASGGAAVKVLAKENIHRTDQDGQISSYRSPVYEGMPLYGSCGRYTPDDVLLETVDECTYEIDEAERTVVQRYDSQSYQITYVFDESGKLAESKSENADGTVGYWYTWTYGEDGLPQQKIRLDSQGNETSDVWTYVYDEAGDIVRREDAHGAWTELTYDEEGYPLTLVSYDQDGEQYDTWSSFEYQEIAAEALPEFMGSEKQWILTDLVY